MPYLQRRSIAFGSYIAPRQAPHQRRRQVRLAGHYGLGDLGFTVDQCNLISSRLMPALRAKWLQACLAQVPPTPPAPPPAPPPVAAPIVAPVTSPIIVTPSLPQGAIPGTPVPVGYPTNQIFVDANGDQWMYQVASGTWIDATQAAKRAAITSEQAQAAQIAAATATSPQGGPAPILVTSPTLSPYLPQQPSLSPVSVSVSPGGYSDILNWLSESTLISPIPNWMLLAGGGFVALKLSGKGHLL